MFLSLFFVMIIVIIIIIWMGRVGWSGRQEDCDWRLAKIKRT
jgi:hypothetical protein